MRRALLPRAAAGWLGVLVLALAAPVSAQPVFDRFTRASGLPSDYVQAIYQDSDGFVWFGTDTGIARYDGRSFRTFTTADGLPHNLIYDFAEHDGALYVATFGGVARWMGSMWQTIPGSEGKTAGQVVSLTHTLLVQVDGGLWRVEGDTLRHVSDEVNSMTRIAPDRVLLFGWRADPYVAVASPDGVEVRPVTPPVDGRLRWLWLLPEHEQREEILAGAVISEPGQMAWHRGRMENGGLALDQPLSLPPSGGDIRDVGRIDAGLIVGAERNLWLLSDAPGSTWRKLLDSPRVADVMVDYEGGAWVATFGNGAYRLRALHLTRLSEEGVVRMHHPPGGDVLFTTETGVWQYPNTRDRREPRPFLPYSGAREVMTLPDGLALSTGASLLTYDSKTLSRIPTDPNTRRAYLASRVESNWWSGIALIGDTLWGSTYGSGVRRFWPGGTDSLSVDDGIPDLLVEGLTQLDSDLWMLTRGSGASVYRAGRFRNWRVADGLPSNVVFSVYRDARGDTWLGTDRGAALIQGDSVRTFTAPQLDGSRLIAFFERPADPSVVWGVTGDALVRFDIAEETTRILGGFDLTPSPEASVTAAVYLSGHDRLLLGTTEGLVAAELSALRTIAPPRVAFTGALLDGLEHGMRRDTSGVFDLGELGPGVRELSLAFAPLAFQNRSTRAEYRLEGGEWRDGSARSLTFAPPTPGAHRVDIRAVGSDGQTSELVQQLAFVVLPSWWQTAWIRVLGSLALIGLGVGAARWAAGLRYRRQLRELEAHARLQRERQRISRDLHDHVGSQLTGLIAGLELAEHERSVGQVAELRGEARNALSQLRRTVWALGSRSGDASELAREIERHVAEQSRFVTHPHLSFEAQVEVAHVLTATEALHLVRIAQEAIQNAIKYANADEVAVRFRADAAGVCVSVEDDGAFVPPGAHSGSGLSYVRERAAEIGAELTFDGSTDGTRIVVRLARG